MIVNDLDLGQFSPNQGPSGGQNVSAIFVEGIGELSYARGGRPAVRSTVINVQAPFAIGGAAAGSRQAVRYAVQQFVEMSLNPDMNPVYIQWESGHGNIVVNPYDGWYVLNDVTPLDFTFNTFVPCQVTATLVALGSAQLPVALARVGGPLSSTFSGPAYELISFPLNAAYEDFFQSNAINRTGAEGTIPCVLNPVANPAPVVLSAVFLDRFKGGVKVFDTGLADPAVGGGSLLSESGFETQSGDWLNNNVGTGTSATADTSNPHSGTYNLKLTNPSLGNYGGVFNRRGIPVAGLTRMLLSAWIKGTAGGSVGPFRIVFANAGTNINSGGIASAQPSAQAGTSLTDFTPVFTTGYTRYSVSLPVPAGYTWAFLEIYANGNGTVGPVYIDDLNFTGPFNPNWVEVRGAEHGFVGDCVITNGLLLLQAQLGLQRAAEIYLWNTSLASPFWQDVGSAGVADNAGNGTRLRNLRLLRVDPEECSFTGVCQWESRGQALQVLCRLQRGRYEMRMRVRELTSANTADTVVYLAAASVPKIFYNASGVYDNLVDTSNGAPPAANFGYGAAFIASATYPFVLGVLYQNPPNHKQPFGYGGDTAIGAGDTTGPALNADREYGIFALPYGVSGVYSPANLQAEAEAGTLGTGWSSVADAPQSAGNVAKCASGTLTGNADTWGTAFVPEVGVYDVWARVKVTSAAGGSNEMKIGLYNSTDSVYVGSTTLKPNQVTVAYQWYRVAVGVTPTAAKNMRFRAETVATIGTDWFIDEALLLPLSLVNDFRGPQDIAQQFLYERDADLVFGD